MDCQAGIVSMYGKENEFLERAAAVLRAARQSGLAVIHVRVGFRPGFPEISGRNRLFAAAKANPQMLKLLEGPAGEVHPALGPEPGDAVVTKHRVGAFPGTDLEMLLRAREIDTLVLFGIATSGVVLATLLAASDADYRLAVIADCCGDRDDELHNALMGRLFPSRADVITADDFVKAIAAG